MNSIAAVSGFNFQVSSDICPIHSELKIKAGSSLICGTCAKENVIQSNLEHQKAVDAMVRKKHFEGARLPNRHAKSGFNEYITHNDGQRNAKELCVKYTKDFITGLTRNLIMVGRTGTGKTHLSCAVARNALDKGKFARYITSEDMAAEIANAWTKPDDTEAQAVYRFTEYDLLILDEYGLHDRHENRLQLVHKVLYARYDEGKPTMLISNYTLEELRKDLGDRLWSRFQHDGLDVVECNWVDQRVGGGV